MAKVHRNNDQRACGATTIATQNFVKIGDQAIAVEGDQDSHGGGALKAGSASFIKINNKSIIVVGDSAYADNLCGILGGAHCSPSATTGADFVTVG